MIEWLALIGLGGVVAIDATSLGQLMLSRPLVAASLAGAIVGLPLEGALLGALLEALSLSVLPVGAARYPETGTAAVATVGTLGLSDAAVIAPALLLVVVYGVGWQWLAGVSVRAGRHLNEKLLAMRAQPGTTLDRAVEHRHVGTLLLELIRGIVVTAAALLIGVPLLRALLPVWSAPAASAALAVAIAVCAVLGGTAPLFCDTRRRQAALLLGVVCGCALLLARG